MKNQITFKRIFNCELIVGKGRVTLPMHSHKCFTVVLINYGNLSLCIDSYSCNATTGTLIVLPSNHAIAMMPTQEYGYTSLCLHNEEGQLMSRMWPEPMILNDQANNLANLFKKAFASSDFEGLADKVNKFIEGCDFKAFNPSQSCAFVDRAIDYLDAHLAEENCIENMLESMRVSHGYMDRRFKKQMHITPKQYLIQNRLRLAKRLLEQNITSVDTAYNSGFAAQSHLCTVFKKYMGISVGHYIKSKVLSL